MLALNLSVIQTEINSVLQLVGLGSGQELRNRDSLLAANQIQD